MEMFKFIQKVSVILPVISVILLILTLFHNVVHSQDIVFSDEFDHARRPTTTTTSRHNNDLLHTTMIMTTTAAPIFYPGQQIPKYQNCERYCVVLDLCPALSKLLTRPTGPTKQDLKVLKYASCGFSPNGEPMVWCENFVCDPLNLLRSTLRPATATNNGRRTTRRNSGSDGFGHQNYRTRANVASAITFTDRISNPAPAGKLLITPRSAFPIPRIEAVGNGKGFQNLVSLANVAGLGPKLEQDEQQRSTISTTTMTFRFPNDEIENGGGSATTTNTSQLTAGINSVDCGIAFPSRISGGETAAKGEFPWIVAISVYTKNGPQIICGGALISDNWVITAAHCVADSGHNLRNVSHIRVGAHNITNINEEGAENIRVKRIVLHEQFRERPVIKNDIALLQLEKDVNPSTIIGSICLPTGSESLTTLYEPGKATEIAGWGSDGTQPNHSLLQKVSIPLVDGDVCKRVFYRVRVRVVTDVQICAGELLKDSCKGDSGGPLMTDINGRTMLVGIISYGTSQCDGRLPGVYTKVTSYLSWIRENVEKYSN